MEIYSEFHHEFHHFKRKIMLLKKDSYPNWRKARSSPNPAGEIDEYFPRTVISRGGNMLFRSIRGSKNFKRQSIDKV